MTLDMKRIKIFISSVQSEFAEERAMLCYYIRTDALLGKFFEPFIFEEVPANEYPTSHVYLKEVENCDIYLGLFGNLYGYEDGPKRSNGVPTVFQSDPTMEAELLELIRRKPSISRMELSNQLNISERQVRKITYQLRDKGILVREGGNSGRWIINDV